MIVASINNGIGNQMFQFAAARALALDRGVALKLDLSAFDHIDLHQGFQLRQAFKGEFDIASESEIATVLGWQRPPLVRRLFSRPGLAALRKKSWVVEPHFQYWDGIRHAPHNCYLKGYWQSEKYFRPHAATIRADFSFNSTLTGDNATIAQEISTVNAVSLHVRRGDYINNPATMTVHGACSLDYYHVAAKHIYKFVDKPVFFVFSDDMPWAKKNLALAFPMHYVEHNERAYNDMHLMSLCKHHVIANSSFSWWGAWLNACPTKIVVAPHKWFAQPLRTEDLLPPAWIKL